MIRHRGCLPLFAMLMAATVAACQTPRPAQPAVAARWVSTANMATPRTRHAAAVLVDGKVLVVGGRAELGGGAFVDTAEVYDPATDAWSNAGNPRFGSGPTATTLANGRVLVAGGSHQSGPCPSADCIDNKAALYDEATNTFLPAPAMSARRVGHTATRLADGRILVAGGEPNEFILNANAELYDPTTNRWAPTGPMSTPRTGHTATSLADGTVLVTGGSADTSVQGLRAAEIYDPSTATWSPVGAMTVARYRAAATLLANGKVLVAGGIVGGNVSHGDHVLDSLASAELYDPVSRSFSPAGTMNAGRATFTLTISSDGQAAAVGGLTGLAAGNHSPLNSADLYNPSTNTWAAAAPMATPRADHSASRLLNGDILMAGGSPGTGSAERYRATTAPGATTIAAPDLRRTVP